jgi:hypothetical protein
VVCGVFDGEKTSAHNGVYFSEYLDKKDKYTYFLDTNQPIITITGGNPDGQKLLLIKESYAHCMVPMLLFELFRTHACRHEILKRQARQFYYPRGLRQSAFLLGIDSFVNQKNLYKLTLLTGATEAK